MVAEEESTNEADRHQHEQADDQEVGRQGEDGTRLAHTAQVPDDQEPDQGEPDRDLVRGQGGEGGGQGVDARRHAHGNGEDIVDQESGGRDQTEDQAEIGPRTAYEPPPLG
jgi:hypothetical protein